MPEKEKILDAWIMMERLSEGDIHPEKKKEKLEKLPDEAQKDFYGYFSGLIEEKISQEHVRQPEKAGVNVFFDIFDFREVIDFLREKYKLGESFDDVNYGKKFSFSLKLNRSVEPDVKSLFVTASAYIRYKKEIPDRAPLAAFGEELQQFIEKEFAPSEDAQDGAAVFNMAFQKLLDKYSISTENCYVRFYPDLEKGDDKLHSFFIEDLEKAKEYDLPNLTAYLFGRDPAERVDLDSKSTSAKYNPSEFERILQPQHYPLGRFCSKTKFALSLMQQVAVNLSCGYDDSTIRSVNGPPGTGKTTLLKDIFANLAVQQAYDMARMSRREILPKKRTDGLPEIGELPSSIVDNNIVVASSNNGAVQNIVNELPLIKDVDKDLLEELKEADYFFELSNARVEDKYEKDASGKGVFVTEITPLPQQKYWGLYSLEGGKSDNMKNILRYVREARGLVATEYEPDPGIYQEFLTQYEQLKHMRETAKEAVEAAGQYGAETAKAAAEAAGQSDVQAEEKNAAEENAARPLDMSLPYEDLQRSNPWFTQAFRIGQSRLFITALRVRKQFLFENRKNLQKACEIWQNQDKYADDDSRHVIETAWNWINLTIPVISSTFASFRRMCRNLGPGAIGHLFVDEAGQAVPQAAVGAVCRSRYVMVVGDPAQIKPVVTLNTNILTLLGRHYQVSEKYLSDTASVQTLVDSASRYGYYREEDCAPESWIGIPLWVHRRCLRPMFDISNELSYNGLMVMGEMEPGKSEFGRTGWFDVPGRANDKFVQEQADFLAAKIRQLAQADPEIMDRSKKDKVYVITPFANVARRLARALDKIGFTRRDEDGKATNIGTIHTFQGKEAKIVFMVMGADQSSKGAAGWAVGEPNMMNVAATRAKEEFYVIGDKNLYRSLGSDVADTTLRNIFIYKKHHPELVDEDVDTLPGRKKPAGHSEADEKNQTTGHSEADEKNQTTGTSGKLTGYVTFTGKGKGGGEYAIIKGSDGASCSVSEKSFAAAKEAGLTIEKGKRYSFRVLESAKGHRYAVDIEAVPAAAKRGETT